MRNKGFFWFITILLTAVCIYQLSFTWVASNEESRAEKQAQQKVIELKVQAKKTGNKALLPNNTEVDFSMPEAEEIAKAAFINQILKDKSEKSVYPVLGSTFEEVKKRSLAFGLDLVGGMSVTLEISIPDLLKNYARNPRDIKFKKVYEAAANKYKNGGDFIEIFIDENKKQNKDLVVKLFNLTDIDGLNGKSSDSDVESYFRKIASSSMDGVEQIMNKRINQFGVAQPNIQKDPSKNRLYIELPGVQDETTVAAKLQSTANLQFYETYVFNDISSQWSQAVTISKQVYDPASLDDELVEEDTLVGSDNAAVASKDPKDTVKKSSEKEDKPTALTNQKGLGDLIKGNANDFAVGSAKVADKSKAEELLRRSDVLALFPDDLKFMWSAEPEKMDDKTKEMGYRLYACKVPESGKADVGGKDILKASTGYDSQNGDITVDLQMTSEGADKWAKMTAENVNKFIAITMDEVVYSAPRVNQAINGGNTQISGNFTVEEAKDLAGLLNGGALPAPCVIKEQTKVGPTIGAENTRAGLISFAIALFVVFLYMYFYYGKSGLVANIALIANIFFIFGCLASFGAVLTLAGIAGIVLTIGMAVDANVLVYERIREELANGKDQASAIDTGYKMALSSIIDANVTTLLTAIVLKIFGSGPIESFATTLIIGIFTSVFAALVISRLIFIWMMSKNISIEFDTKLTKNAFRNLNINFIGKRKLYYIISTVLVVGSLVLVATKGLKPSVEFSGGRTYGIKFDKSVANDIEFVKANLTSAFGGASVDIKTKSNNFFIEITTNYLLSEDSGESKVKAKLTEGLNKCTSKLGSYKIVETRSVSSTVSGELITSSSLAIGLSLVMIFAYILLRFGKWQYSFSAIAALFHDVVIVLGVFSLFNGILPFNMDVDQAFIAAILTVIGYSINDTVVVFDRIREDLSWKKNTDLATEVNGALNSTLSRTINTSMTTIVVLIVIFLLGGSAIKGFVFALLIGIVVGTYSSLLVASPMLLDLTKSKK
ncbi:MAG: protein translocase subunit SecDF [Crocinitomicaceae bacterium]|nr:protein translocase subunit SecDF [Crocinitomicaceae bacterium]MCF8410884.1 protein translocase subunit SecDF [Crocinitomicaceae bacterium]MCF8444470.1 protein translocase subunit SecDF [Crocinitomicaceae bacterium]